MTEYHVVVWIEVKAAHSDDQEKSEDDRLVRFISSEPLQDIFSEAEVENVDDRDDGYWFPVRLMLSAKDIADAKSKTADAFKGYERMSKFTIVEVRNTDDDEDSWEYDIPADDAFMKNRVTMEDWVLRDM